MESRRFARLIATAALVLCCVAPCPAHIWSLDYVDWYGLVGTDASLVLAPSAKYVAYTAGGNLYLATDAGSGWTYDYVTRVGFGGGWCSAAGAPPGIAYIDDTGAALTLRYAWKSAGVWNSELVDDAGWLADYVSMRLTSGGAPVIAYTSSPSPGSQAIVKLARRTGVNTWTKETVATIGDVTGPSLAFDSAALPAVSFVDPATGAVRLARRSPLGAWTAETVAGTSITPASWYTSLAFSGGTTPCVAYYLGAGAYLSLHYASKPSLAWVREVVHPLLPSGVPQYCSLALDAHAKPSIAYLDSQNQTLRYARRVSGSWYSEAVDDGYLAGYRPSLAFHDSGAPAVAYVDTGFSSIKYATTLAEGIWSPKLQADGGLVAFSGAIASTAAGEFPERLYVQAADRSMGVQVYLGAQPLPAVVRGSVMGITGISGTRNGERCVLSPEISVTGAAPAPVALGMRNSTAGGGGFYYDPTPPAVGQQGVDGAAGLTNIGLLIRTSGRVTASGAGYLYVDDGSGIQDGTLTDGSPNVGVRVTTSEAGYSVGEYLLVTGLSSCFYTDAGLLERQILPRNSADLIRP